MPLPKKTQSSTLDRIPLEVLFHVLRNLDIHSLRILIRIYRRSRIIFSKYHNQIISQILSTTLPDPNFPLYFPLTHNNVPYPLPANLAPLQTSHAEAYTHLRYAKSLVELSTTISTLTSHIYSITAPKILDGITPAPRSSAIPLNHAALFPYEEAIISTIHQTLIGNAQILFYTPNLHMHPKSQPFTPPPRPTPPQFPESVARRLLPRNILPKNVSTDYVTSRLSDPDQPWTPLVGHTFRALRKWMLSKLMAHIKRYKIFKDVCITPSWDYVRDPASLRDQTFFYFGIHPALLLKVLNQCDLEDKEEGEKRYRDKVDAEHNARKVRKSSFLVTVELGKFYSHICKITHEYLQQKEAGGTDMVSQWEEAVSSDPDGSLTLDSQLQRVKLNPEPRHTQEPTSIIQRRQRPRSLSG
ncbi:hypothetical protein TWF730_003143 [Orbilia blumenaviensis]|uniref:F-box domain-containing protein n=1 Tax=Orbilia blumenaviensis TaxID=1796055 RepID=A0AAV9U4I0_9PEZI